LELSVSKQATITEPTGATTGSDPDPKPKEPAKPTAASPVARMSTTLRRTTLEDVFALFAKCYLEANHVTPQGPEGQFVPERLQAVQAAAATLMIAAQKEGLTAGQAAQTDPY
jgi:hypothetical protein